MLLARVCSCVKKPLRVYGGMYRAPKRSITHVLGIESTCDETGVAVVGSNRKVISSSVASQWHIHKPFKGIVPSLAARAHEENLPILVEEVLANTPVPIDAVAVSAGPGLAPCLRVGVEYAVDLARKMKVPIIGVNHLEAHVSVTRLEKPDLHFPFIALLVSGGHTQLLYSKGIGQYEVIGTTLDDAVGEAFDKVARILEIDAHNQNAGAALETAAQSGDPYSFDVPVPLRKAKNCHFSFSGIKSSMRRTVDRLKMGPHKVTIKGQLQADLAASFQHAAVTHLIQRSKRAIQWICRPDKPTRFCHTFVVCGGVAANSLVRKQLQVLCDEYALRLVVPDKRYCTDNGEMIAWTGLEKFIIGHTDSDDLTFSPRWPLGENFVPPKD